MVGLLCVGGIDRVIAQIFYVRLVRLWYRATGRCAHSLAQVTNLLGALAGISMFFTGTLPLSSFPAGFAFGSAVIMSWRIIPYWCRLLAGFPESIPFVPDLVLGAARIRVFAQFIAWLSLASALAFIPDGIHGRGYPWISVSLMVWGWMVSFTYYACTMGVTGPRRKSRVKQWAKTLVDSLRRPRWEPVPA